MLPIGAVTPRELRIAGEHAEGMQGEGVRLAYRDVPSGAVGDNRRGIVVRRGDLLEGDVDLGIAVVAEGPAPTDGGMRSPKSVTIDYGDGAGQVDLTEAFDSLFWGPAAIEKFVLPYYLRLLPTADFDELRKAPYNNDVMAIGHARPTIYAANPGESHVAPGDPTLHMLMRGSETLAERSPTMMSFTAYLHARRQQ